MRKRETIDWGIDLGTTNSCIAIFEDREPKVIKNSNGDETTPSVVYEKKIGDRVIKRVGKVAKQKLIKEHEHVALEFKQMMGTKDWYFEFPSTGRKARAVDLSAEILKELVASVKQKEGEDVYAALITVPAAFLDPMYEDTKKAGEKAGIRYVEVLEEPVAAALAYGLKEERDSTRRIWLAYDLGGGTFDAALVKIEEGVFSVFDHEGIRHLGGKHLDAAIVERYFISEIPSEMKNKIVPWKSSMWWTLKFLAEEAKCQLSTKSEYIIDEVINDHDFVYTFTREQLDKLEKEIFSPTIEKCRELLARNNFKPKHIEKVILIGGPTLSPYVRKMIEEELNIPVDYSVDPLTAVACGAAIYARSRKIPNDTLREIWGVNDRDKHVMVELYYPSTTQEDEVMVTGKLKSKNEGIIPSSRWSVEIRKVTDAGEILWSSGKVSVSEAGGFVITGIPIEEGENLFTLEVIDGQGRIVEIDRDSFLITNIIGGKTGMPYGIGVAAANGDVIWFFEKGTPLPTEEKTKLFTTTKELKKGEKGDVINIPIVQGNENKAYLNRVIKILKVYAENVSTTIPKGSDVEVTIKMDSSRKVSVNAWFPHYSDVEVSATVNPDIDISFNELNEEFKKLYDACNRLEENNDYNDKVKKAYEEIKQKKIVEEIDKLVSLSKDNPEYRQQAMDKILELKKILDPIVEDLNDLIKWNLHKDRCDNNVNIAKKIVEVIDSDQRNRNNEMWRRWKTDKLEPCLKDYDQAVNKKDLEKMEVIAYGDLPALFLAAKDIEVWFKTIDGKDLKITLPQLVSDKGAAKSGSKPKKVKGLTSIKKEIVSTIRLK